VLAACANADWGARPTRKKATTVMKLFTAPL
jgi:hypothetical protein